MNDHPELLTIPEVAARVRVSPVSIRRRIADGRLPAVRVGPRVIYVRAVDVEALLTPVLPSGDVA